MKIAIVGAGVTGSVVASELAKFFVDDNDDGHSNNNNNNKNQVVIFDQGRRGPGGRASHRSVIKKKKTKKTIKKESNISDEQQVEEVQEEEEEEFVVLPDDVIDESSFHFDHGCQFFRADSRPMKNLVEIWLRNSWVAPWKAKFGCLPETNIKRNDDDDDDDNNSYDNKHNITDFFGLPSSTSTLTGKNNNNKNNEDADVYIGVGGMHLLPRRILNSSKAIVHPGTRVKSVVRRRLEEEEETTSTATATRKKFVWDITTVVGKAAYHDTKESEAAVAVAKAMDDNDTKTKVNDDSTASTTRIVVHRGFDIVIFTDISSSSDSWHRASAGVPTTFTSRLPTKIRLPLFSCMIALSKPLKDILPFDAFTVNNNDNNKLSSSPSSKSPLWFAARSSSKPGFPKSSSSKDDDDDDDGVAARPAECWTLISTPAFAVNEIQQTTMRDPITGEFRPQENKYLNSIDGPSYMLKDAFYKLARPYLNNNNDESLPPLEEPIYIQGQRWGSGIPLDPKRTTPDNIKEICGTQYATKFNGSLVYPPSSHNNNDDDDDDDDDDSYYSQTIQTVEMILTFAEDFVKEAQNMDKNNKSLLGKILKAMVNSDNDTSISGGEGNKEELSAIGARSREEALDKVMKEEKANFTTGFLRHLEGECNRIENAQGMTPESTKLLEILRLVQTRVLEELGQDLGEAALVLGQLMGYDKEEELLGVLEAGLTVQGRDFALEMASLTEEALDGFKRIPGGADPELVEKVNFINKRLQEYLNETSEFQ